MHNQASLEEFFYGAVTVGERGQVVIPAEARKHMGLHAGDKLLVFRHPHAPGLLLSRLHDVQAFFRQLQQLGDGFATIAAEDEADGG